MTLLPTLTSTKIPPQMMRRCTSPLALHSGGLIAACGFYAASWNTWAGISQLFMVVAAVLIMQPLLARIFAKNHRLRAAAISVIAGVIWLVALCAADAVCVGLGKETIRYTRAQLPDFL